MEVGAQKKLESRLPTIGEDEFEEKMIVGGVELTPESSLKELQQACKFLGVGVTGSKQLLWQRLKKEVAENKQFVDITLGWARTLAWSVCVWMPCNSVHLRRIKSSVQIRASSMGNLCLKRAGPPQCQEKCLTHYQPCCRLKQPHRHHYCPQCMADYFNQMDLRRQERRRGGACE